jgi:hypothetical protein
MVEQTSEKKIPARVWVMAFVAFLLAGPVTFIGFLLGGAAGGALAILALVFFFVVLYMLTVRKYVERH